MAERVVVVCDECGRPAQAAVTFKVAGRNLAKDLCRDHLEQLVRHSHPPKRGRRPTIAAHPPALRERTGGRERRAKAPPKGKLAKGVRARITDPGTLEKRRAALQKARRVLAAKRASAKKQG